MRGKDIVPGVLIGIWCCLMIFGVIALLDPPFLKALERPGIETESAGYVEWGDKLVRDGDYRGALQWYGRALKVDPTHVPARVNAAAAYGQLGQHDDGIRLLREALDLSTKQRWVILYHLAELNRKKGDRAQAARLYEDALAADGRPDLIYARLGDLYDAGHELERARDAFLRAKEAWEDPQTQYRAMLIEARETTGKDSTMARGARAALARGVTETDMARYDSDFIRRQNARDPELARIYGSLGMVEAHLGDTAIGYEHLKRSLEMWPANRDAPKYRSILARTQSGK